MEDFQSGEEVNECFICLAIFFVVSVNAPDCNNFPTVWSLRRCWRTTEKLLWMCLDIGNPTCKLTHFTSGTRCVISITARRDVSH